jgi:hypothetical protein
MNESINWLPPCRDPFKECSAAAIGIRQAGRQASDGIRLLNDCTACLHSKLESTASVLLLLLLLLLITFMVAQSVLMLMRRHSGYGMNQSFAVIRSHSQSLVMRRRITERTR